MRGPTTGTDIKPQALSPVEFENYRQLVSRAVDVFGSELKASTWLSSPQRELNGEVPLDVARKHHYEPEFFDDVFGRIEHGIYF